MQNHDERDLTHDRGDGVRIKFGPVVEAAITQPGADERPHDQIVWLLWTIDEDAEYSGIPNLHAICTTEYSIRYHVGCLLEQNDSEEGLKGQPRSEQWLYSDRKRFHIERAPCDHAFGSSLLRDAQKWQLVTPPISVGAARKFPFGGE